MEIKNIEIQDSDGNVFYPHTNASVVKATDTSGLDGIAGKSSDTQTLLDKLADRVANKLIEKGMIANNLVTDNENMVLAAPMGKKLQEQISDVNKNINGNDIMKHLPLNTTNLNPFNIDDTRGNWIAGFANENMEGTFPHTAWQNIVQFDTGHFENQISMQSPFGNGYLPEIHLRSKYAGGENQSWTNWNKIVTNSDIGNIIFKRIESEQISNANDAPFGLSVISPLGSNNPFNFWATLITTGQELYSQQIALPWSNLDRPKYRVKDGGTWHDWTNMYG